MRQISSLTRGIRFLATTALDGSISTWRMRLSFTYRCYILLVSVEPPYGGKDGILGLLQSQLVLFRVLPLEESIDIVKVPLRSQETKREVYQSDVIA
jgi:hypothetical protein